MTTPMSTTTALDVDEEGQHVDQKDTEAWSGHSSTWRWRGRTSSSRYVCALVFKRLRGLRIGKRWSKFSGTCITLPTSAFGIPRPLLWRFTVFGCGFCRVSVG
jgi:hypothetical protein